MKTRVDYWFHVTGESRWGDIVRLKPRTPEMLATNWEGEPDEPLTPRICVAPTVAHCFSAITCGWAYMYVYRTQKRVCAEPATGVGDSFITKEHWITKPTTFIRVGVVQEGVAVNIPYGPRCDPAEWETQKEDLKVIRSLFRKHPEYLKTIGRRQVRWL